MAMKRHLMAALCALVAGVAVIPGTAYANHTNPREKLAETDDPGTTNLLTFGEGEWEFIRNFPANPGTDLKFFRKGKSLFAVSGTLGQANTQHVGQRFIQLIN